MRGEPISEGSENWLPISFQVVQEMTALYVTENIWRYLTVSSAHPGQLLLRLIQLNEQQNKIKQVRPTIPNTSFWSIQMRNQSFELWKSFLEEFYCDNATFRYSSARSTMIGMQPSFVLYSLSLEIGIDCMPRIFELLMATGVARSWTEAHDFKEYTVEGNLHILVVNEARIRLEMDKDHLIELHGQLRLTFVNSKPKNTLKIWLWEYDMKEYSELFTLAELQNQQLQAPTLTDTGLPLAVTRCMELADVLISMNDLLNYSLVHNLSPLGMNSLYSS